jgi:hypothetical protein
LFFVHLPTRAFRAVASIWARDQGQALDWKTTWVAVMACVLAACAPSRLDDTYAIRDADAAIAIATALPRCLSGEIDHRDAILNGGIWVVKTYYDKGAKGCNWETATIDAKSGKPSSICEVCVVAD